MIIVEELKMNTVFSYYIIKAQIQQVALQIGNNEKNQDGLWLSRKT